MASDPKKKTATPTPKRAPTIASMKVRPNPAHARDHYGEPCAAVPHETHARGAQITYIGARIDFKRSRDEKRIVFEFDAPSDDPVEVPQTAYYVKKLEEGEILPACEVSSKHAQTERAKAALQNAE